MSTDWNVNTHFGDSDWRTLYHKFPNKKKKKKRVCNTIRKSTSKLFVLFSHWYNWWNIDNLYLPITTTANEKFQLSKDACVLFIHFMHDWILPSVTYSRLSRLRRMTEPLCSLTTILGYGQIDQTENMRFATSAYIQDQPVQIFSQARLLLKCNSSWSLLHLLPRSTSWCC